jgi:hypothetical protein
VTTLTVPSHVTAETFYAKVGFKTVCEVFHGDARTIVMERHLVGNEHEGVAMGVSWCEPAFPGWYRILRRNSPDYGTGYNMLC